MPQIDHMKPELAAQLDKYRLVADCVDGQEAVKRAGTRYLPMPNAADTSAQNQKRYESYVARAVFYNVTKRTSDGLVGQVFAADPTVDLPPAMDVMKKNTNGTGVDLDQLAKHFTRSTLAYGRSGLFLDFPAAKADGSATTREEMASGERKPVLTYYGPTNIINWRTRVVDNKAILSLVVLLESWDKEDDGFKVTREEQWRVLSLDENLVYSVSLYRKEGSGFVMQPGYPVVPTDASGQPLNLVPFVFVGSRDNSPSVDDLPLYDLAALNLAHYRNSADYEDACFMVGQPTPWFSGLTREWVDEVMKGVIELGSRAAVPLPAGASAGLLQAMPNTMPREAMEHKEKQMVALGAKLVEQRVTERTLGEASMDQATQASALAVVAKNVGDAFTTALRWAARFFYGDQDTDKVVMTLSTDFAISKMGPQERAQLMAEWQAGAVSDSEYRDQLRQSGIASLDDEEWKDEVESSPFKPAATDDLGTDPANPDPVEED